VRIFFFIAILLCFDIYIFTAIKQLTFASSIEVKWLVYSCYWGLTIFSLSYFLTYLLFGTDSLGISIVLYWRSIAVISIISKLPILLIIGIDDIRRFIALAMNFMNGVDFDTSRSKFIVKTGLAIGTLPFVSLIYGIIRNPYRYKLYKSDVPIMNLASNLEGLRIVQISDIHSGSFTFKEPIKNAIEMINAQKPDLVFFTGDLVNSIASEMEPYIDVFNKIQSKYGVYSILGNHDYGDYFRWPTPAAKEANMDRLKAIHREMGWQLLLNEHKIIKVRDSSLGIIGVENISGKRHFKIYGDMKKASLNCPDCDVKILLSHDPSHWEEEIIMRYKDIDLTLSGHTHGMQFGIEIPGFIKFSPIQFVYKKWAGLYKEGNQYLYVNRGLGFLGYPGRVGILPEITLLELKNV